MRLNGSIVGPDNMPTENAAGGVWSLRSVYEHVRASRWPTPAPPAFAPDQFANLTFWLDATDISTMYSGSGGSAISSDGDAVGLILSKGSINRCAHNSGDQRPLYKAGIVGGKSVLRFDASNDGLAIADVSGTTAGSSVAASTLFGNSTYTCVGAVSILSASISNGTTYANHRMIGDTGFYMGVYVKSIDGSTCSLMGYAYTGAGDRHADVNATKSSFVTFAMKHDGSNILMRVNGGSWASMSAANVSSVSGNMAIGYAGSTSTCNMDLAHLATYTDALSDDDIDSIEQYFASELGI